MSLIKVQIVGATQLINKFFRKLTKKFSDALVFDVTRIPCVGEIIEFGSELETQAFRVTKVVHYTVPDWCSAWGCITVEPCNLLLSVSETGEGYKLDNSDNDYEPDNPDNDYNLDDLDNVPDDSDNDYNLDDLDSEPNDPDNDYDLLDLESDPDDPDNNYDLLNLDNDYDFNENSFSSKRRFLGRLPNGICTPEEAYKLPILQAIDLLGGSAKTKDVLTVVKKLMKGVLKKVDYEKAGSSSRSETRWQKRAKWVRYDLIAEGLVNKDSPRGVWEISKMGHQHLTRYLNR